jgi:hypothetical protein
MPIFVNEGYERSPDGKEWKHLEKCSLLAQRAARGFPIRRLRNLDAKKVAYADHLRRRCPRCMPDSDWPGTEPHNPTTKAASAAPRAAPVPQPPTVPQPRPEEVLHDELVALGHGPTYRFADWPNPAVPPAAGAYTVWDGDNLIYAGMAGRSLSADDVPAATDSVRGLRSRLGSHATGRRSGNQFCVYICDRFVVPSLTPEQQRAVGSGTLSIDRLVRDLIHTRLSYRFVACPDARSARTLERLARSGALDGQLPLLNPLQ